MGPNETAITIPEGPRVISVFDVHGCSRAQIKHFFGMPIGSRTSYWVGLMVGSRLHRMRMRLELYRDLWIEILAIYPNASELRCILVDVSEAGRGGVCGVGSCARLVPTLSDPGKTSGLRVDSIPLAQPIKLAPSAPRIKKISF